MSRSNGILSTIQTNFDEKSLSVKLNSNQKRNIVKMLLSCFVLGTGTIFSIPLGDKVSIKKDEYSIESLTIDILKEYIWERKNNILKNLTNDASKLDLWHVDVEEVVNVSNESDIIQKLGGNKMKPNFLFSKYFIDEPPAGKIHIIIQPPATTGQGHTDISRVIATLGYLPRQGGLGGTMLPCDLKVSSTNEGVDINDPDVNPRFDIIPPLIRDLIDKRVILVRAPPFSGKTSIAQILEKTLVNAPEFLNCRVIRVSLLWKSFVGVDSCFESFRELWKRIIGLDWFEWLRQCMSVKTILIIDEAQLIYGHEKRVDSSNKDSADQFWMVVKGLLQEITYINIIMFAAYGYRSSNHTGLTTPVNLPASNYKSLVDINFTSSELKKHVEMFSSKYFKKLDQQGVSKFYEYIQVVTEGHAGFVHHILVSTEVAMKWRIDANVSLTWKEIFKYLNSKSFDLSIYANCRAVPKISALSKPQSEICENVYLNGKSLYIDSNEDHAYLVKSGVLVTRDDIDDIYLTFAAPLLKRSFFQQYYGVHSTNSTPTDLHHFIVKTFTAMCNKLSRKVLRETLGFGSDGRILEQTWQKEFYRIGTQVLGKSYFMSCDVGSVFGCDGKIDFYVDKLDWAIELLRDGEDMKEHKARFEPSGEYEEIVKYAKNIAIIDIRSIGIIDTRSEAKNVRKMKEDFIYVSCSKDFDAFKIESLGKETVTISFQN